MSTNVVNRRQAMRLFGAAALAAIPAVKLVDEAAAGRAWCRKDPVVKIDGQVADIWISSYQEMLDLATGPVTLVVKLPRGATGELLATDQGFGYGYNVRFETSDWLYRTSSQTQVRVSVYCPASESYLPVRVDFVPRSSGRLTDDECNYGVSNSWVVVKTD